VAINLVPKLVSPNFNDKAFFKQMIGPIITIQTLWWVWYLCWDRPFLWLKVYNEKTPKSDLVTD
jgi:hypothetical protein